MERWAVDSKEDQKWRGQVSAACWQRRAAGHLPTSARAQARPWAGGSPWEAARRGGVPAAAAALLWTPAHPAASGLEPGRARAGHAPLGTPGWLPAQQKSAARRTGPARAAPPAHPPSRQRGGEGQGACDCQAGSRPCEAWLASSAGSPPLALCCSAVHARSPTTATHRAQRQQLTALGRQHPPSWGPATRRGLLLG